MMLRITQKMIEYMVEVPSRTGGKRNADVSIRDFFKFYKDKYYTKKESSYNVSGSTYRAIISDFNKTIGEKIVKGPYDFKIPCKLGFICLRKYKKKPKIKEDGKYTYEYPVDWKATLDLWKRDEESAKEKRLVRHLNKETGGYIFKVFYFKRHANFRNRSIYNFRPVRAIKTLVKDSVKKGTTDAYELR